jgi:hypothetical protein
MLVMWALAAVCVLGILGALASTVGYDQLYGQEPRRTQPPPRSVRRRPRFRRASRQLRAVEAALTSAAGSPPEDGTGARPPAAPDDPRSPHEGGGRTRC